MNTAIATLIASGGGFVLGLLTATLQFRQKREELFLKALDWLGGGSQNRNVGISAVELYLAGDSRWAELTGNRFRDVAVALLTGSAIYLISGSERKDSAIEVHNLERIIVLLLQYKAVTRYGPHYERLKAALTSALNELEELNNIQRQKGL